MTEKYYKIANIMMMMTGGWDWFFHALS